MGYGIEEIFPVRLSSPETKTGFVVNKHTAMLDGRKIMGEFQASFLVPPHFPPELEMMWQGSF